MAEPTIAELLDRHVTLTVECLDRLYLNGYVPTLQTSGYLVTFLTKHRGAAIPSPVLLDQMTTQFVRAVRTLAQQEGIPIIRFKSGERKDDVAAVQRQAFSKPEGVVFIGVAQEKAQAFKATKRRQGEAVGFDYSRQPVYVNYYYFYLQDTDFGPAFIKVCSYAPFGIKVYVNGHEWAKQQMHHEGLAFEALDNGFLSCADPARLQAVCERLGPPQLRAFFAKWLTRLPLPLTAEDRAAGYDYRLSVWQLEVSRTQVFDDPVRGREFFEEVIRENVDLGRPDRMQLLFDRRVYRNTPGRFRTRVLQDGVIPSLHVEYKHCHVKQYFKEGRALRTETTINDPTDLGIGKDLSHLPELQQMGRQVNRRLLDVQRVSQACTLSQEQVERVVQPTVTQDGHRAPALRFGDPRVMALLASLVLFLHLPAGLTHRTLRPHIAAYLGRPLDDYSPGQLTYDLRRLRRKGLLTRVPHTHHYQVTPEGRRIALFFTRLHARVFRPGFAAFDPTDPVPRPLADAFAALNRELDLLLDQAHVASSHAAA